jgi:hypothetical protein
LCDQEHIPGKERNIEINVLEDTLTDEDVSALSLQSQDLRTFEAPLAVMRPLVTDSSHQRGNFCVGKYLTLLIDLLGELPHFICISAVHIYFPSGLLYLSGCLEFDWFLWFTNIVCLCNAKLAIVAVVMVPKFAS